MTIAEDAYGIDLDGIDISVDALCRVPRALALRHDVLTVAVTRDRITVALPDCRNAPLIEQLREITGLDVQALSASKEQIRARLARLYPGGAAAERSDDAPAVRIVAELHANATRSGASDVHIEPHYGGGRIRERIDGELRDVRPLTLDVLIPAIARIKLLAGMDIGDKRQPQDGRYSIVTESGEIDVRASCIPTAFGEKVTLRIFRHRSQIPALDALGMPRPVANRFRLAVESPSGLIVLCGPTGSGKTTTLYSAVLHRNNASANICTVEDPVEIRIPGISQVQVNPKAGVSFASALRAFLRQDPDAIMIGELRDAETANAAASAALTGQLILTTVHAADCITAIARLVELGIPPATLAAGVTAIVSQRLLRRAEGTGRTAIFEAVFPDDRLASLIASNADVIQLRQHATSTDYVEIAQHGLRLLQAGETTADELRRVLPARYAP